MFTDVDLTEDVTGLKLATIVRDRYPGTEVLMTSRNATEDALSVLPERPPCINKPYNLQEVLKQVQTILKPTEQRA